MVDLVAEFLAKGGEIKVVPITKSARKIKGNNEVFIKRKTIAQQKAERDANKKVSDL